MVIKFFRNILTVLVFTLSFAILTGFTEWSSVPSGLHASFVSNDLRFPQSAVPKIKQQHSSHLTGWRGERLSAQVLLWSAEDMKEVDVLTAVLKDASKTPLPEVQARFVRYVLTDEFGNKCGYHDPGKYPPSLSADIIDNINVLDMDACTVLPVWITVDIPASAVPGLYPVEITIQARGMEAQKLSIELEILDRVLPPPSEWSYFLDLWQHPAAVARIEGLEMWSDAHFDALVTYMQPLARVGQKVITATLNKDPWNNQCYDPYADMIRWTHNVDGSWSYDYSVFDRWVELMINLGIDRVINCYSLLPWNNEIHYYDAATGKLADVKTDPGTGLFNEVWTSFLMDFTKHLRKKGWLERTNIAMDERSPEEMNRALDLLRRVAPELGIAMADNKGSYANYPDADIMSVKAVDRVPQEYIDKRREKGLMTTYYVCCSDSFPNMFTFSLPAEGVYAGWYAAACDYDGFLRWAYNSWVENPLTDSRFRSWPAGDSYIIYPGFRSSIRFERLMEGIQDFEKIQTVRKELAAAGTPEAREKLAGFNTLLAGFATISPEDGWVERLVEARRILNELSKELLNNYIMNRLSVKKLNDANVKASELSSVFDKEQIPFHAIDCVNWADYPYQPDVKFRIAHNGTNIFLNYQVEESDIKAVCAEDDGRVWEDACVEFFVTFPNYDFYTNIECNCIGKILASTKLDKQHSLPAPFNLAASIDRWSSLGSSPVENLSGKWEVSLVIPLKVFRLDKIHSLDGIQAKGNFYKCGDLLKVPHYLSWNPIKSEQPNFHLPAFFGEICFEG